MDKKIIGRITSLVLGIMFIVLPSEVGADFIDMPNNWSRETLERAVENRLLFGEGNRINGDSNISRAELIAIINRMLGAEELADISAYKDVNPNKWYYNDIRKAVASGFIAGDPSMNMRPDDNISRQEVFSILDRLLILEPKNKGEIYKFKDLGQVDSWARPSVERLIEDGYLKGSSGYIKPRDSMTRAEFATIIDGLIYSYMDSGYSRELRGNVVLRGRDIELNDSELKNLIFADGASGELYLENVEVEGKLLIRSDIDAIYIMGNSKINEIYGMDQSKELKIIIEDGSRLGKSNMNLKLMDFGKGQASINRLLVEMDTRKMPDLENSLVDIDFALGHDKADLFQKDLDIGYMTDPKDIFHGKWNNFADTIEASVDSDYYKDIKSYYYTASDEEKLETIQAYMVDNAYLSYGDAGTNYRIKDHGEGLDIVATSKYKLDREDLIDKKIKAENKAEEVVRSIEARIESMNLSSREEEDFYKVLYIHDYICQNTNYNSEHSSMKDLERDVNDHSAYGALVVGEAVCDSYSKSMQLMCKLASIDAIYVIGYGEDSAGRELHSWNKVKIGGDWYNVDSTWDDMKDYVRYDYFLKSDRQIEASHSEKYLDLCVPAHRERDFFKEYNLR